jgi:hypothetical protein
MLKRLTKDGTMKSSWTLSATIALALMAQPRAVRATIVCQPKDGITVMVTCGPDSRPPSHAITTAHKHIVKRKHTSIPSPEEKMRPVKSKAK